MPTAEPKKSRPEGRSVPHVVQNPLLDRVVASRGEENGFSRKEMGGEDGGVVRVGEHTPQAGFAHVPDGHDAGAVPDREPWLVGRRAEGQGRHHGAVVMVVTMWSMMRSRSRPSVTGGVGGVGVGEQVVEAHPRRPVRRIRT